MPPRFALPFAAAAAVVVITMTLAGSQPAWAQNPPPAPTTQPAEPEQNPPPAVTTAPTDSSQSGVTTQPTDAFGETITLTAKQVVYVKGSGTWDNAYAIITSAFKKLDAYLDKEGLKADGRPMTIFTSTDDTGFQYQAEIPIAAPPKSPPHGDIALGQSPEGAALKFVHRGSYDGLDNTYEAITNYLDEKRLEAKDMFIEEYVTDPVPANQDKLVVNVYVLIKPSTPPPG